MMIEEIDGVNVERLEIVQLKYLRETFRQKKCYRLG